jgi:hypothetical protein
VQTTINANINPVFTDLYVRLKIDKQWTELSSVEREFENSYYSLEEHLKAIPKVADSYIVQITLTKKVEDLAAWLTVLYNNIQRGVEDLIGVDFDFSLKQEVV